MNQRVVWKSVVARAVLSMAVLAVVISTTGGAQAQGQGQGQAPLEAASTPTGPIVAPGTAPRPCTEADAVHGATGYNVVSGFYWSDYAQDWIEVPYCYPVWGYLAMSSPVVVEAGNAVTMTAIPKDGSNIAGFVPSLGGMSWSVPGTPLSGCTPFDLTCTVILGTAGQTPTEWNWQQFRVSGPSAYVTWIPQIGCSEATPCPYTTTQAWSFAAVRPVTSRPTADFTFTVDGGQVSFSATSTDPEGLPLFHEWQFGDGTTGVGANPAHTYTTSGEFAVRLTSTNTAGRSDWATKMVEVTAEPLAITNLEVDPNPPVAGDPVTARVEITNNGDRPAIGVTPTVTATPPEVISASGTPEAGFTLAPGASRSVEVPLDARRGGDGWVSATATATVDGAPVSARLRTLAVKVDGPALEVTLDTPADRPRQGEPFEISMTVANRDSGPATGVRPTLDVEPGDRVQVTGPTPAGPLDLAPAGEPGDRATFSWTLTAERTAKVEVTAEATATAGDGDPVTGTAEATVELDADLLLDWEIAPRFVTDADAVTQPHQVTPTNYSFTATVRSVNGLNCDPSDTFVFQADGRPLPVTQKPFTCLFDFTRPDLEPFDLEGARVVDEVIDSVGEERVEARDFFIVSIGDSLSSGEGNPRRTAPIWTLQQCHRSGAAGPAEAAKRIEEADRHSAVTFLHLACSGARTITGLTGPFNGIEPGTPLRPQIPEIARFADGREIDAVIMSIGANDIDFGRVVSHCLMSIFDCQRDSLSDGDETVLIPEFMRRRVDALPDKYARSRAWLDAAAVDPSRVFLLDYPNATRDHDGNTCTALSWTIRFTEAEWSWAEVNIAFPLNAGVATAAATHGYRPVTGFGPLFERHGYCSRDSWITSVSESVVIEGRVDGAFHPNHLGHERYAERIHAALSADLFIDGRPRPATDPGDGPARLAGDTAAGDQRVEVRGDRFRIGDRVVIDPGTHTAEVRTIVDRGSLIFDRPLEHPHPAGALIVLDGELPGALDFVATSPATPEPEPITSPAGPPPTPTSSTPQAAAGPPSTPATSSGTLPRTGSSFAELVLVAVLLASAGAAIIGTTRRTRHSGARPRRVDVDHTRR